MTDYRSAYPQPVEPPAPDPWHDRPEPIDLGWLIVLWAFGLAVFALFVAPAVKGVWA